MKSLTAILKPFGTLLLLSAVGAGAAVAETADSVNQGATQESSPTSELTPNSTTSTTPAPTAVNQIPGDKGGKPEWQASLATLIAGALGFLAALLVEKRSWKRRKLEQVREAQLAKITGISRQLYSFNSILARVERDSIPPMSTPQSSSVGEGLWQAQARAAILTSIPSMETMLAEVQMMSVELMTLRVKSDVMTDLNDYLSKAIGIVNQIQDAIEISDISGIYQAANASAGSGELGVSFNRFVAHALDGLSE